jgi:hypothetical protein
VSITEELLGRNSSGSGQENREYERGIRCADHATPSIRKSWYYFAKKRRSLGRHGWLADQSHGVFFYNVQTGSEEHPASDKMGTGGCSPGVKQQEREAYLSPQSSAEVNNGGAIPSRRGP